MSKYLVIKLKSNDLWMVDKNMVPVNNYKKIHACCTSHGFKYFWCVSKIAYL